MGDRTQLCVNVFSSGRLTFQGKQSVSVSWKEGIGVTPRTVHNTAKRNLLNSTTKIVTFDLTQTLACITEVKTADRQRRPGRVSHSTRIHESAFDT